MRKNSAGVGILIVDLQRRPRATPIDQIVEVNGEQRRPRAHKRFAPPARIELLVRFRNDVLPAMVVEVFNRSHGGLPCLPEGYPGRLTNATIKPQRSPAPW